MIIEVKMFTVECDNCKKISGEDSEFSCWGDEDVALDDAKESGWIEEDGKHYCPDCYSIDENDLVVLNDERKDEYKL